MLNSLLFKERCREVIERFVNFELLNLKLETYLWPEMSN